MPGIASSKNIKIIHHQYILAMAEKSLGHD
jgi:hypothetical protein